MISPTVSDNNKILKHLITQFCHDIAGPISAISNVVELGNIVDSSISSSSLASDILEKSSVRSVSLLKIYRDIIFVESDISCKEFIDKVSDYLVLHSISIEIEDGVEGIIVHRKIAQAIGLFCIKLCKNIKIASNYRLKLKAEFQFDICILTIIEHKNLPLLEKIVVEVIDYISPNCEARLNFSKNRLLFTNKS